MIACGVLPENNRLLTQELYGNAGQELGAHAQALFIQGELGVMVGQHALGPSKPAPKKA